MGSKVDWGVTVDPVGDVSVAISWILFGLSRHCLFVVEAIAVVSCVFFCKCFRSFFAICAMKCQRVSPTLC